MAARSVLGFYMGACETQNATAADIESHTAAAGSFRYPGGTKNCRTVTTPITPADFRIASLRLRSGQACVMRIAWKEKNAIRYTQYARRITN